MFRVSSSLVLGVAFLTSAVFAASTAHPPSVTEHLSHRQVTLDRGAEGGPPVQFKADGHVLDFRDAGWLASNGSYALRVEFAGANPVAPRSEATTGVDGQAAPLVRVSYENLWDGIDLAYRATPSGIAESIYTIAPGVDPGAIRLRYNAPLTLNDDGTLTSSFPTGTLTESAPVAWQEIGGRRLDVPVRFALAGGDSREIGFAVGAHDPAAALYIDPTLVWNTFYGPQAQEEGYDVAVDAMGNSYYLGASPAVWNPFPSTPVRPYSGGDDAFVLKLDPDGKPVWLTFLGGAGRDFGFALELYASDAKVVVTGRSSATWGTPVRPYSGGAGEGWVAQLSTATGVLEWNTFLGGTSTDEANHVSVVESGDDAGIYVAGSTAIAVISGVVTSQWGAPVRDQSTFGEGFAAKLDLTGALVWNTFLGGGGPDAAWGIDVLDSAVYVVGQSGPWGSGPAPQGCPGCPLNPYVGRGDAFVARLEAMTGNLVWNTFFGGPELKLDVAYDVKALGTDIYVVGQTSGDWGSPVLPYVALEDAFVARLSDAGALLANTFFGTGRNDRAQAVDVEGGRLYVGGRTGGSWGTPVRPYSGYFDMFVAGLDPSTLALQWNGFYGGPGTDGQDPIAGLDATPDGIWIAGRTANVRGTPDASWGAGECPGCPLEPFFFQTVGEFQSPSSALFAARLPSAVADLAVTKTDGKAYAVPGSNLPFTVVVTNNGPDNVTGATVTDDLSAMTGVTWTCTVAGGATCGAASGTGSIAETVNLPAGGTVTYQIDATLPSNYVGDNFSNTASVAAAVGDPNPANNTAVDTNLVRRFTNLKITKTGAPNPALAGDDLTFTVEVQNSGPSDATGVLVEDTFPTVFPIPPSWTCTPAGGASCSGGSGGTLQDTINMPVGSTVTYTITGTIDDGATDEVTNTATVTPGPGQTDPFLPNDSATAKISLTTAADLSIDKDDGNKTVTAGGTTTYTIIASNAGPSPANGVTVTDSFPASLTLCTWTCASANSGSCTASGSGDISDSAVSLPANASVTYTAICTVAAAGGSITNTASVSGPGFDPNLANNSDSDVNGVDAAADLIILKSDGRLIASPGEATIYAIEVTNLGPSDVPAATATDTFPAELQNVTWNCSGKSGGVCSSASGSGNISENLNLPVGATVEFTISAKIDPAASAGTLSNTATVTSTVPELDPTNNTATDSTQLEVAADLVVLKSDGKTVALTGEPVTYSVIVSNTGPSNEPSASVLDSVPVALQSPSWTCKATGGATCTAGPVSGDIDDSVSLPAGSSLTYTLQGTLDPAFTGTLSNTATATPSVPDPATANNSWTDTTEVLSAPDIAVTKSDGRTTASAGDPITYTIVVSNVGTLDEGAASVTDTLPAALESPAWTCAATGGAACTAGPVSGDINDTASLPAGSSVTYSVQGTIRADFIGTLTNTATVSPSSFDLDFGNNSSTDTTEVEAAGPNPPQPIPALDERGLAALMLMLLGIALWHHGRGRRA